MDHRLAHQADAKTKTEAIIVGLYRTYDPDKWWDDLDYWDAFKVIEAAAEFAEHIHPQLYNALTKVLAWMDEGITVRGVTGIRAWASGKPIDVITAMLDGEDKMLEFEQEKGRPVPFRFVTGNPYRDDYNVIDVIIAALLRAGKRIAAIRAVRRLRFAGLNMHRDPTSDVYAREFAAAVDGIDGIDDLIVEGDWTGGYPHAMAGETDTDVLAAERDRLQARIDEINAMLAACKEGE